MNPWQNNKLRAQSLALMRNELRADIASLRAFRV
jgi:hypothetical protein